MKKYIVIIAALITLASCTKQTDKATLSATQITDTSYAKVVKIYSFDMPYTGARVMYYADTLAVKELYFMVQRADGQGWKQYVGDLHYQRFLIAGDWFKYFFHLVLKDNSTFDTQVKEYWR